MIDFTKFLVIGVSVNYFLEHTKYKNQFFGKNNSQTGEEYHEKGKATFVSHKYKDYVLKIITPYENKEDRQRRIEQGREVNYRIELSGSIHKFHNGINNGKEHNYNDFRHVDFLNAVKELCNYFEISPQNLHITQLEFGVNIIPLLVSKDILENCLFHQRDKFKDGLVKYGTYKQAYKGEKRLIKIYDKMTHYQGLGFDVPNEVLRVEVKLFDMYHLRNTHSIYTLNDLYNTPFETFREPLLKAWNSVVFISPYLDDHKDYSTLTSHQHWYSLFKKSKTTVKRHKDSLNELNRIAGKNLKNQILNLIDSKITELQELPLGGLVENRICLITGISISMQRVDSSLLSINGLRYYYKHQKRVYLEVKNKYLSSKWINDDVETQINEIAHNIRNKKSNLTIKKRRFIDVGQLSFAIH